MTRVLVLDEGFMSGALAGIGLRDAGCDVDIIAAVGGSASCHAPRLRWGLGPPPEAPEFEDVVAELVAARNIDVVYPVTDPLLERCSTGASAWHDRVFRCVGDAHQGLLSDKAAMSEAAARQGVSVPRQLPLAQAADVVRAVTELGLPLVVKGVRGRGGSATHICSDAASAHAAFFQLRLRGLPAFAQQYIDGPTLLVGGVFREGVPLRLYAGEKTMQHPPRTGPAVEIRSVNAGGAIEAALAVFAMLRFTGIGSADLVQGADGVRFLELNPRPWGSLAAVRAAGVDCFTPLVQVLQGESPAPDLRFAAGVTTRILPLYLLASPYRRRPVMTMRALAHDLRGPQGEAWQSVRQGWHLLRRLQGVGRRWNV